VNGRKVQRNGWRIKKGKHARKYFNYGGAGKKGKMGQKGILLSCAGDEGTRLYRRIGVEVTLGIYLSRSPREGGGQKSCLVGMPFIIRAGVGGVYQKRCFGVWSFLLRSKKKGLMIEEDE